MKLRNTLAGRIGGALLLAGVAPTAVLGVIAVRETRQSLSEAARDSNVALISTLAQDLNTRLQEARRSLDLIASLPAIGDEDAGRTEALGVLARREPLFRSVYLLDPAGALVESAGAKPGLRGLYPTSWGGYVTDAYMTEGAEVVTMIVTVRGKDLRVSSYLCGDIDLTFVGDVVSQMPLPPHASLLVVDANRRVIAASAATVPAEEISTDAAPVIERVHTTLSPGALTYEDAAGREWLAVYRNMGVYDEFRGLHWGIVVQQETRHAFALARRTAATTAVVTLLFLIASVVGGRMLTRRIVSRLSQLARGADRVAAGERVEPLFEPGLPAELAHLAQRFDDMAERIASGRAALEQRTVELVRSEKLSSVGVLAAGVAHEINNPLTAILGYGRLLLERTKPEDPSFAGLSLITSEAERVQVIVRNLLDFSVPVSAEMTPVDVSSAVSRILAVMAPQFRQAGITVETRLEPGLPPVLGDQGRLQQIVVNLASNAIDAAGAGKRGTVRLSTGRRGDQVWIEVSDSGSGIPRENLSRLFDPFFTTKGPGRGTGLGLSISDAIAREHKGAIEVESEAGQGATFRLVLPAALGRPAISGGALPKSVNAMFGGEQR